MVPKTCAPDDFFGQVKRTVNGKPITNKEIKMIVTAIKNGLKLKKEDVLFDLGCGNGALSVQLFLIYRTYLGIDFSQYLIEIAKKNFEKEKFKFEHGEANEYLENSSINKLFTKGLCYGVFTYFEKEKLKIYSKKIREKFPLLKTLYLGNLADKDRAANFYYKHIDYSNLLDDNQSSIGIWRNKTEIIELCNKTGWKVNFHYMPKEFYSAHYRFDAILTEKIRYENRGFS